MTARAGLEGALNAIHARLQVLDQSVVGEDPDAVALAAEQKQIEERSAIILAQLDSLGRIRDSGWRGPMTGLRASVAALEHRTDLAFVSATGAAGADSLFDSWLAEVAHQLAAIDGAVRDSLRVAAWHDEIEEVRSAHAALTAARPKLVPGADTAGERSRFADDLVLLRRRMRAFIRSADALAPQAT